MVIDHATDDLFLDEDRGEGASFVLRLPRMTSRKAAAGKDDVPQDDISLRVLVVDDERPVREALTAQLGGLGCEVTSTASADEAMTLLGDHEYDALLVDVRMPETSGVDFHNLVAEKDPTRARRMVFMTGDFTNEEILEAVRATGRRLLEKPFTVDELRTALWEHAPKAPKNGGIAARTPPARPAAVRPAAPPPPSETSSEALNRVLRLDP